MGKALCIFVIIIGWLLPAPADALIIRNLLDIPQEVTIINGGEVTEKVIPGGKSYITVGPNIVVKYKDQTVHTRLFEEYALWPTAGLVKQRSDVGGNRGK